MDDDTDNGEPDGESRDHSGLAFAHQRPGGRVLQRLLDSVRVMPAAGWVALGLLLAALVFTTTLALIQKGRADGLAQRQSMRAEAAATAGRFGVALYTYDYTDLGAARARVLLLATPSFAKRYDATNAPEQAAITRLKARESAKVTGLFLTDVVRDRAAAMVILQTTLQSTTETRRSVSYLQVALVRTAARWKVDAARAIPTAP